MNATALTPTLDKVDYADQIGVGRASALEKFRVQVPLILLGTLAIQYAVSVPLYGSWDMEPVVEFSMLLCLIANLGGLVSYRRLRLYPGTRRLAFIWPSFALSWSITFGVILVSRLPYSSPQLGLGLVSAMFLSLLLNACSRRVDDSPFLTIRSPRVDTILAELPDIKVKTCTNAREIAASSGVIVADLHEDLPAEMEDALARAALRGVAIYHIKHLGESLTGRVQINHLSENSLGSLAPNPSYASFKSLMERGISAVALVVLSPILLLAAIAIRLDSSGPALFRQTRIGARGEPFTIYKFRTMMNASRTSSLHQDITQNNDPRITRIGRWMRDSRIDELPQLINVVRGEMSLIGPRPETANLSQWYAESIDFYAYRHVVLPGITGWAQVKQGHVASREDVIRKLQYDFYYIKNFSLWLDMVIALKTVKVMLRKLGAR